MEERNWKKADLKAFHNEVRIISEEEFQFSWSCVLKFSYSILIVQRNHMKRQLDENKNTPSERICPIVHILSYNIEDFFFKNEVQA